MQAVAENDQSRGEAQRFRALQLLRRRWYRWAFQRADKILVITDAAKDELAGSLPEIAGKLVVVDNPYITEAMFNAGRQRSGRAPGRLLAIGRLVPQKELRTSSGCPRSSQGPSVDDRYPR